MVFSGLLKILYFQGVVLLTRRPVKPGHLSHTDRLDVFEKLSLKLSLLNIAVSRELQ